MIEFKNGNGKIMCKMKKYTIPDGASFVPDPAKKKPKMN